MEASSSSFTPPHDPKDRVSVSFDNNPFPNLGQDCKRTSIAKGKPIEKVFGRTMKLQKEGEVVTLNRSSLVKYIAENYGLGHLETNEKGPTWDKVNEVVLKLYRDRKKEGNKPVDNVEQFIARVVSELDQNQKAGVAKLIDLDRNFRKTAPTMKDLNDLEPYCQTREDLQAIKKLKKKIGDGPFNPRDWVGCLKDIDFPPNSLFSQHPQIVVMATPARLLQAMKTTAAELNKWLDVDENIAALHDVGAIRLAGTPSYTLMIVNDLFKLPPGETCFNSPDRQTLESKRNDALDAIKYLCDYLPHPPDNRFVCTQQTLTFSDWRDLILAWKETPGQMLEKKPWDVELPPLNLKEEETVHDFYEAVTRLFTITSEQQCLRRKEQEVALQEWEARQEASSTPIPPKPEQNALAPSSIFKGGLKAYLPLANLETLLPTMSTNRTIQRANEVCYILEKLASTYPEEAEDLLATKEELQESTKALVEEAPARLEKLKKEVKALSLNLNDSNDFDPSDWSPQNGARYLVGRLGNDQSSELIERLEAVEKPERELTDKLHNIYHNLASKEKEFSGDFQVNLSDGRVFKPEQENSAPSSTTPKVNRKRPSTFSQAPKDLVSSNVQFEMAIEELEEGQIEAVRNCNPNPYEVLQENLRQLMEKGLANPEALNRVRLQRVQIESHILRESKGELIQTIENTRNLGKQPELSKFSIEAKSFGIALPAIEFPEELASKARGIASWEELDNVREELNTHTKTFQHSLTQQKNDFLRALTEKRLESIEKSLKEEGLVGNLAPLAELNSKLQQEPYDEPMESLIKDIDSATNIALEIVIDSKKFLSPEDCQRFPDILEKVQQRIRERVFSNEKIERPDLNDIYGSLSLRIQLIDKVGAELDEASITQHGNRSIQSIKETLFNGPHRSKNEFEAYIRAARGFIAGQDIAQLNEQLLNTIQEAEELGREGELLNQLKKPLLTLEITDLEELKQYRTRALTTIDLINKLHSQLEVVSQHKLDDTVRSQLQDHLRGEFSKLVRYDFKYPKMHSEKMDRRSYALQTFDFIINYQTQALRAIARHTELQAKFQIHLDTLARAGDSAAIMDLKEQFQKEFKGHIPYSPKQVISELNQDYGFYVANKLVDYMLNLDRTRQDHFEHWDRTMNKVISSQLEKLQEIENLP